MKTRLFRKKERTFTEHPKFKNVGLATFITGKDTGAASVCLLEIPPEHGQHLHAHDPQVDSIFVPETAEHGMKNTGNEALKIFVHHSPPLL